jgi:plasmid stabilization system protein ParE
MKVVWSRRAIDHLVSLREDSEQNAALAAKRILKAVDLLQTQPEMGRPGRGARNARTCRAGNALHHPLRGSA